MKNTNRISEIMQQRRAELGLTLTDVARLTGVNYSTAQRWESGKITGLKPARVNALAAALQVSPEYLLGWTEDPRRVCFDNLAEAAADLTDEEIKSVINYIAFLRGQRRR